MLSFRTETQFINRANPTRLVAALLLAASAAPAWGPTGHRVVALIAERNLDPLTRAQVELLLDGETLAEASTWADDVRERRSWRRSAPWHYVNIDDDETYKSSRKNRRGDVLRAIERFEKDLRRRANSHAKRANALRFLIHFVADVHQPLHVGRWGDRGGNTIDVFWFGQPSNLHRVWDSAIISRRRISFKRWAASLKDPTTEQAARWVDSTPLDWAAESQALRPLVYRIGDGKLGRRYYRQSDPVVRERLVRAGLRLAALLERLLG